MYKRTKTSKTVSEDFRKSVQNRGECVTENRIMGRTQELWLARRVAWGKRELKTEQRLGRQFLGVEFVVKKGKKNRISYKKKYFS